MTASTASFTAVSKASSGRCEPAVESQRRETRAGNSSSPPQITMVSGMRGNIYNSIEASPYWHFLASNLSIACSIASGSFANAIRSSITKCKRVEKKYWFGAFIAFASVVTLIIGLIELNNRNNQQVLMQIDNASISYPKIDISKISIEKKSELAGKVVNNQRGAADNIIKQEPTENESQSISTETKSQKTNNKRYKKRGIRQRPVA